MPDPIASKSHPARVPAQIGHLAIRAYQVTLSSLIGRHCRYLPTCSDYTDQAIAAHGLWAGSWMGLARICRCNPWGGSGFDPAPATFPPDSGPLTPWRYGSWRAPLACEPVEAAPAARPDRS